MNSGWIELENFANLSPSGCPHLSFLDVRQTVRLLGETLLLHRDPATRRNHLFSGLRELIGADQWDLCWQGSPGVLRRIDLAESSGGMPKTKSSGLLLQLANRNPHRRKTGKAPLPSEQKVSTVLHRPVRATALYLQKKNCLAGLSEWRDGTGCFFLSRRPARRPFGDREKAIVEIIANEVNWIHLRAEDPANASRSPALSPKKRAIVQLLASGSDRKAIARTLNISIETTHSYIKEIYTAYGVRSQAELARSLLPIRP